MKAKELIEELVKLVDEHGDLEVVFNGWSVYLDEAAAETIDIVELRDARIFLS